MFIFGYFFYVLLLSFLSAPFLSERGLAMLGEMWFTVINRERSHRSDDCSRQASMDWRCDLQPTGFFFTPIGSHLPGYIALPATNRGLEPHYFEITKNRPRLGRQPTCVVA